MQPEAPLPLKLPPFRKDLKIYAGPYESDGTPTYNIHDPVKGIFVKISWKEYLLIRNFPGNMTAEELAEKISNNFPFKITAKDVNEFFTQAFMLGLLNIPVEGNTANEIYLKKKQTWFQFFSQNLFFLKIPLFQPNDFLTRTLPYVKFLGSKPAILFYILIIFFSSVLLLNRFDEFLNTFTYSFTLQNLLFLGIVISFVKCVHELSHAYVAKSFGLFIPTIGIGFLFFMPLLYTDVTESWKLMQRKQRFWISIAGIVSELILAGLATFGWIMASSGLIKSLFFLLASTTWFSSLLINSNPFIRFDGYYILSDLSGIDNLMQRSFSYTRWMMHRYMFGINEACPEEKISQKRALGFILYAIFTIIYRFFMYTAIVYIVYHSFTKVIGLFLFLTEILILVLLPINYEIKELFKRRDKMTFKFSSVMSAFLFLLFAGWFCFPFPHDIQFDGVIVPKDKQLIYSTESGKIEKVLVKMGQKVTPGKPLMRIQSEILDHDLINTQYDQEIAKNELLFLTSTRENESLISKKVAELDYLEELLLGFRKRKDKLDIRAEVKGEIVNWDTKLKPGQYVFEKQIFGSIADPHINEVIAFASETDVDHLRIGQSAKVFFQSSSLKIIEAEITHIDHKRINELIYPSLASIYGGPLAVVHQKTGSQTNVILHDSYFQITLAFKEPQENLNLGSNVEVKTRGPWRSYFLESIKYVIRVLTQESSF
ncbi:MAG: HlyD family efflux transporter periplasmic adaptor subunit [Candidatus Protochlamydia sp.]|nr:HlyD family efflux transporter periplasmic adaptor subunit [Candidatus Protochlamydia sp.]